MAIQLTNTLSGKKELLVPLSPNQVHMYVCGPTVYNFIHIGNARPLVFFDVVRRYLEFSGFSVVYVMNYTDIDDKIIQRAKEEKTDSKSITEKYIAEYEKDMALLGVKHPTRMPRVTEHLPGIISLIERLIEKGAAYVIDGEVFFAVRKFTPYGKLSGKNPDDMLAGARVEVGEKKRDPLDFSLWKPRKEASEPAWESPWGLGRPGWHIECSVMSMEYLGETFDIHGGGMDLIHPHHENEIAQSEAVTEKPLARYWMHNNMLNMGSEKMSKSLGNILLTREFIERYSAEILKFMLLSGHYRSLIDFSSQHLRESQAALHRIYSTINKCHQLSEKPVNPNAKPATEDNKAAKAVTEFASKWREAMDDDFNTARSMGQLFELVRSLNAMVDRKGFQISLESKTTIEAFLKELSLFGGVVNLFQQDSQAYLGVLKTLALKERNLDEKDIQKLINDRIEARKKKDFATSDAIRQRLLTMGIELKDGADTTSWDIIFTAAE